MNGNGSITFRPTLQQAFSCYAYYPPSRCTATRLPGAPADFDPDQSSKNANPMAAQATLAAQTKLLFPHSAVLHRETAHRRNSGHGMHVKTGTPSLAGRCDTSQKRCVRDTSRRLCVETRGCFGSELRTVKVWKRMDLSGDPNGEVYPCVISQAHATCAASRGAFQSPSLVRRADTSTHSLRACPRHITPFATISLRFDTLIWTSPS